MKRLSLKVVGSFVGNCLIITDNTTGKNVEVMSLQLAGVIKSDRSCGSFPHGGWEKDGESITIYHDDDKENHEVTFTILELEDLLQK